MEWEHLILVFLLLLLHQSLAESGYSALYTVSEQVGAGNLTHVKLYDKGPMRLVLETIRGDADLYISDSNPQPGWMDYDLQSVTCGEDVIQVPVDMNRPVYIGIYGHPSHDVSVYKLRVYNEVVDRTDSVTYTKKNHKPSPDSAEEESLLWNVFVGILKILLDVLV